MDLALDHAVLAVDGGRGFCRMALDAGGKVFSIEAGPTDVVADPDTAALTIKEALARLAQATGYTPEALAGVPAYLGFDTILDDVEAEALRARLPFRGARIGDARHAALTGALGPGVTGGFACCSETVFYGHRSNGTVRLAGGIADRVGDTASAAWITRQAIAATIEVAEGILPATALTETLTERLEGLRGIVRFTREAGPAHYAALADFVVAAAVERDPVARRIVKDGAASVARTLRALGWRTGETLCLVGAVSTAYARHLPAPMRDALTAPVGDAIDGALALARAFVEERDA